MRNFPPTLTLTPLPPTTSPLASITSPIDAVLEWGVHLQSSPDFVVVVVNLQLPPPFTSPHVSSYRP